MAAFTPELLLAPLSSLAAQRIGWIAYSGGLDSTVLLHALVAIRHRLSFELRALHVDHGLHPDSRAWAGHCGRTCERLGVPLQPRSVKVVTARGESLEAVARKERYQAMADTLEQGDLLLTAQHRDDQAETLLLALMRGSGPKGLAAMPAVAPLGAGRLVRPLLGHGRAELLAYAEGRCLSWLEDPSNRDLGRDRNFIRHLVLPVLTERWPGGAASIARSAAHCAEAQALIDLVAEEGLAEVAGQRPDTLSVARLAGLALPLRKQMLRHWIRARGLAPPGSRHLDCLLTSAMSARADANPLVAWPGCEVRRYRDDLFAMEPLPPVPAPGPIHWAGGGISLPQGLGHLELRAATGGPRDPWSLFPGGLEIRFGVQGLLCRQAPGGHRRSLKKLFQEAAVPPWARPRIPLIFADDALVAVADLWVCHAGGTAADKDLRVSWRPDGQGRMLQDLLRNRPGCGPPS